MKIAIGSDMKNQVTEVIIERLQDMGHEVLKFGALKAPKGIWSKIGLEVGQMVAEGKADQGILFCWTGTGISIAANKVKGVRAALCFDAETAKGARQWNDANVLVMSLRLVSEPIAKEILNAWFEGTPSDDPEDQACIAFLDTFESRQ